MNNLFNRMISGLRNRVTLMISKAIIKSVNDSNSLQLITAIVGASEIVEDAVHLQPFGITAKPEEGGEALVLLVNGNRDIPIVINAGNSSKRPKGLSDGEVCIYKDNTNKITFKSNGDVEIECEGDIKIGNTGTQKLATEDFVDKVYKLHVHPTATGTTSKPTTIPMPTELTSQTEAA